MKLQAKEEEKKALESVKNTIDEVGAASDSRSNDRPVKRARADSKDSVGSAKSGQSAEKATKNKSESDSE